MDTFDKDYTLNSFVALMITEHSLNAFFAHCPDFSYQEIELLKELIQFKVTLEDIDNAIAAKDITNEYTHYGSGDRERGFLMEYIKERYEQAEYFLELDKCTTD